MPERPKLPNPMMFEGLGLCFWEGPPEYRCPNRNEFYASGAEVQGYRARQHMAREYWIVRPTHYARQVPGYVRSGPVQFTQGGVPLPRRIAEKTDAA